MAVETQRQMHCLSHRRQQKHEAKALFQAGKTQGKDSVSGSGRHSGNGSAFSHSGSRRHEGSRTTRQRQCRTARPLPGLRPVSVRQT